MIYLCLGKRFYYAKETFYIKSQEEILKNKKHPHCDKLECKLLNRLEDVLVISSKSSILDTQKILPLSKF